MISNPLARALFFIFLLMPACFANSLTSAQEDDIMRGFLWQRLMNMPKEQRPRIGLTLSAGGMRGFSHIGVLEVLKESGLRADYISGTSMGCIVSALYIAGVPFSRMRSLAYNPDFTYLSRDISITGIFKYVMFNKLFSSENFQEFISKEVGGVYFENLPVPLACASADIKTGEKVVFDSGPLALGVRASMNLPGIFAPVEYRQRYLVDGGVVDYMPVDLVRAMGAQWVLSVFALPDYSRTVPSTILGYVVRTSDIRGALITENSEKSADFLLGVRVGDLDFSKPAQNIEAVEIGVRTAYGQLDAIKDNFILFSADYAFK
jgi:NTE family protein